MIIDYVCSNKNVRDDIKKIQAYSGLMELCHVVLFRLTAPLIILTLILFSGRAYAVNNKMPAAECDILFFINERSHIKKIAVGFDEILKNTAGVFSKVNLSDDFSAVNSIGLTFSDLINALKESGVAPNFVAVALKINESGSQALWNPEFFYIVSGGFTAEAALKIENSLMTGNYSRSGGKLSDRGFGAKASGGYVVISEEKNMTPEFIDGVKEFINDGLQIQYSPVASARLYMTGEVRCGALEYINRNWLSLLDGVVNKLDWIELVVLNGDDCRVNFNFKDIEACASGYEVLVGYKDLMNCFLMAAPEMKNIKRMSESGFWNSGPEVFRKLQLFLSEIEYKIDGKVFSFVIKNTDRYIELSDKFFSVSNTSPALSIKEKNEKASGACIAIMNTVEAAAECYLSDNPKTKKLLDMKFLVESGYLRKMPVCPQGGNYILKSESGGPVGPYKMSCDRHAFNKRLRGK